MADRRERSGYTARQAVKAIQQTSPDSSANLDSTAFASENAAEAREQNQMFPAPGKRAVQNNTRK
ncbi:hypothetical protein LOK74_04725 [Brevibacillus humidisoli]|uniref:hypothetical protein n=1 Tax=Brevibacillus humidisoli TaxID=2895522 RepID=UPI001E495D5F|nr:hypothetical protein [Brevibacillus humidisoli]UFJ41812.1 hypothetical protein LOK74_04725 [Brevibacillus humidisoli]